VRVQATKENARLALEYLRQNPFEDASPSREHDEAKAARQNFIEALLDAASRRLPSERALARDRRRKRSGR
jgi:hypothetical protein